MIPPENRPTTCQWSDELDGFTSAADADLACGLPAVLRISLAPTAGDPILVRTSYVCRDHSTEALLQRWRNATLTLIAHKDRSN